MSEPTLGSKGWKQGKLKGIKGLKAAELRGFDSTGITYTA